ncbi:polysaccharide pyruvyl transferase family protein [Nesterenkonia populi]
MGQKQTLNRIARRARRDRTVRETLGHPERFSETIAWKLSVPQGDVELAVQKQAGNLMLTCSSEDPRTERALRAMLVTSACLKSEPKEHHQLHSVRSSSLQAPQKILRAACEWAQQLRRQSLQVEQIHNGAKDLQNVVARGIWYDRLPNFGDAVGPWLVAKMTGKEVVNVRRTRETPTKARGRAVLLVGSIIQMLNRNRIDIWGSGLMRPLSDEQVAAFSRLEDIRVHAVRGSHTAAELRTKLGWHVPDVYGDPALLLPRFLPVQDREDHIAVVPHLKHRNALSGLENSELLVSDVREDLEIVVHQIASARACVSTSLHGIIIAQAYGVPWVWLNVSDSPVDGRDFKFDDFFTTIDAAAVAQTDISLDELATIDFLALARRASLPELRTDLDALEKSLPLRKTSSPTKPSSPPNNSHNLVMGAAHKVRRKLSRRVRRLQNQ